MAKTGDKGRTIRNDESGYGMSFEHALVSVRANHVWKRESWCDGKELSFSDDTFWIGKEFYQPTPADLSAKDWIKIR